MSNSEEPELNIEFEQRDLEDSKMFLYGMLWAGFLFGVATMGIEWKWWNWLAAITYVGSVIFVGVWAILRQVRLNAFKQLEDTE